MEKQKFAGDLSCHWLWHDRQASLFMPAQIYRLEELFRNMLGKIRKQMMAAMQVGAPITGLNDWKSGGLQEGVRSLLAGMPKLFCIPMPGAFRR